MFEHRLGLALGKSLGEIRALPYDEYQSWKHFYSYEPWGWHDLEYRTAMILAQIWNVHIHKRADARTAEDYIRDMPLFVKKAYAEMKLEEELFEKAATASLEEKKRMIAQVLGANK